MDDPTPDVLQILVLEDDIHLARSLTRLLTARSHDVKETRTVADALNQPGPYDVAVLDLNLPDGSGSDAGRELLYEKRTLRVIFFTGELDTLKLAAAEKIGTVVSKIGPKATDTLIAVIETALRRVP